VFEFPNGNKRIRLSVCHENFWEIEHRNSPPVSTAIKFGTGQLLLELTPFIYTPGEHPEVLDFVPKVKHVLLCERMAYMYI
jgi:hypothetical protein